MVPQQWDGRAEPAVMPPPAPELGVHRAQAPLGLVAALSWEVRPLLRRQNRVERQGPLFSFALQGRPVWLAIAGIGSENSFQAARHLLERHRVRGLVTLGFAGALVDSLASGEIVIADRVLDQQSREQFGCDGELLPLGDFQHGTLLSAPGVVATAAEKRRLAREWSALAADMESSGVARAAAQAGVPFCAIKAISDTSDQSISIDFAPCWSEHMGLSLRKLVRETVRSPQGVRDLWMLARGARVAARSLAAALCAVDLKGTR